MLEFWKASGSVEWAILGEVSWVLVLELQVGGDVSGWITGRGGVEVIAGILGEFGEGNGGDFAG